MVRRARRGRGRRGTGTPFSQEVATMLAITAFSICLWIGNPLSPWVVGLLAIALLLFPQVLLLLAMY